VLGFLCAAALWSGCETCPLRNLDGLDVRGVAGCCGAFTREDVTVSSGPGRQIDLANTRFPAVEGTVDLWLVRADCEQLFDGSYPGSTPRCSTLLGPVAPGAVSNRIDLAAGRYRVFAQAYSSNAATVAYVGDVGIWGNDCNPNPTAHGEVSVRVGVA
jgi:hypothetical protein